MAPHIPNHVSTGTNPVISFHGALITEFLEPPPGRCFAFRQTYKLKAPVELNFNKPTGPPLHFHPWQNEWFRCVSGRMGIEIDGKTRILTPEDGEIMGRAGCVHRFFLAPDSTEDMTVVLSASDTGDNYMLDRIFFENWYGMWHDGIVSNGGKFDLIQLLSTFDGGDCYLVPELPLPLWARKAIGQWGGVVLGRWIGGLLGYKPFFKEYTTDWDLAVAKMRSHWMLRLHVATSYQAASSWAALQERTAAWVGGGGTEQYVVRAKTNGVHEAEKDE
ncbi:putative cupin -type protein [Neofusicoccum parvum]|uniref:Cupin -type protein n=1 Tax=Neofusicoccum parvum TaxID=310453 RepID=A0ACB5SBK2_9PEZI|nr:putative cupin -type protein [Neofusicoccum parvum]GME65720.1 putative cupin -type protein [Neofusicoccum parvum]